MNVVVLGATGMLGSAVYRFLGQSEGFYVTGVARSAAAQSLGNSANSKIRIEPNMLDADRLESLFADTRPEAVINCIGVVKQLADSHNPLVAIPINALLPHRLSQLCRLANARLIHISTDCVFSGTRGNYRESDSPDAMDLYGVSKHLGEVTDAHTVTLRTSIIGHERNSANGLVEWFLSQNGRAKGFTKAIFSGVPTVELSRIMRDYVLLSTNSLSGLYHVSAEPISKYNLLALVAKVYGKKIELAPVDEPAIDRSLNSEHFRQSTGYTPPDWTTLVEAMRVFG